MPTHNLPSESNRAPVAIGALFLGLAGLYLLTFSGRLHSIDEFALFGVADSLVQRGSLDINALWWAQKSSGFPPGIPGPDGHLYSKMAPGMSLIAAPFVWLGHRLALGAISTALLTNIVITALTFSLLALFLLHSNLATRKALAAAALAGSTTLAWPYARFLFAAPLLSFGLVAALLFARRDRPGWAGAALALALLGRLEAALALPWLAWYLWRAPAPASSPRPPGTWRPAAARLVRFLLPIGLAACLLLGYNWLRFGSLARTGYGGELQFAFQPRALGTLLFSPGLGFFVYAPLLLVGLAGARASWRRWPRETVLTLGLAASLWAFYGSWHAWDGGWGWGPRFLTPLVPLLCLPLAALLDGGSPWRWLAYPAALAGALINAAGAAVDFNAYFFSRNLIGAADVYRLADWPPVVHWQLFLAGERDLAGLSQTWPALVLLGLSLAALLDDARRAETPALNLSRRRPWLPALLALALVLAAGLPIAAGTRPANLPPETAEDLTALIRATGGRPPAGEVGLLSFAPYAPVSETMAFLLDRWHRAPALWAWIADDSRGLSAAEEAALIDRATARARFAWLWQQPDPGSPDLAASGPAGLLARTAFIAGDQAIGQTGHLSRFSLPGEGPAPVERPLRIVFGAEGLTLTRMAVTMAPWGPLQAALFWQPSPGLSQLLAAGDVVVSLRLLDEGGGLVAQTDRLLISQQFPLQSLDHLGPDGRQGLALELPPDLPAGNYQLRLQLYHGGSLAVIPAANGDASLKLLSLPIQ